MHPSKVIDTVYFNVQKYNRSKHNNHNFSYAFKKTKQKK